MHGHATGLRLVEECLLLLVLKSLALWFLVGFSDNVSHILVGTHHGCCSRVVTRGLDRCVLDDVNARSLAGSGYGSFAVVRCTGFMDGVLSMGSMPG